MELPKNAKDFPAFMLAELSAEKFPEWNRQMALLALGMLRDGCSKEDICMHMLSMAAGAVSAINDLQGAK